MTLRGASRGLRPARSRSAQGACGPPRASLRFAGSRAPPGGMRPGSRGHQGPTRVARLGALRCPRHKKVCALVRPGPVPCCAGAPAPARFPVRPARPRPLRGSGPSPGSLASLALPGPRPFPPALPLGGCARLRAPPPLAGPVWLGRPIRSGAGFLSVALPLLRVGCRQRVAPPGPPLAVPPGFGPGRFQPGGCAGLRPAFLPRPRAVPARARLRALASLLRGICGGPGFSPAPPRPAVPAGASGEHRACSRWPSAPRWVLLFAGLPAGPPPVRGPGARALGAVDSP